MDSLVGSTAKMALAGVSVLIGGGAGAALGTVFFPGPGTAMGYLIGIGIGAVNGSKAWDEWSK